MGALDRVFRSRRPSQQRPLAAIIAGLWRNGEQGVRFEASDLATMFQDAAGTLPVYAPGQGQVDPPVGLWLDKRLGLVRGPDMVTNGDFATAAGWANTSGSDWTFGTGAAVRTATALANGFQTSIPAHVAGRYYLVSFEITAVTNAGAGISAYLGAAPTPPVTSPGKYSFFVLSDGTAPSLLRFYPRGSSNFFAGSIDNVSLQAIPGNHAYQTTTTSRPTLSARYNLLTYSEQFDAAAWAKVECSVIPNVAVGPNGGMADKLVPSTATAQHTMTCPAGSAVESRTALVVAKADGCQKVTLWPGGSGSFAHFDLVTGIVSREPNVLSSSMTPLGDGWYELRATWAVQTLAVLRIYTSLGSLGSANTPGDGVSGILLERADLRTVGDGVGLPEYQRVVDPNTYDTVFFPPYLRFDGVDDWLRTSDIDFSGVTALFVAAAARKLSDAARGTLCELSSSYSNPGSFALEAPGITLNSFMFAHTGATTYKTLYRQLPAPVSAVVVGVSDLPSGYVRLSAKSPGYAQMSDVTTDVGGGSYATASLFIGRRAGSSQPFNGRLYSLYIRGGSSTAAQLSAVERHMNQQARIY